MVINLTRQVLLESLVEFAGFKAGIVLTQDEIMHALPQFAELLQGEATQHLRVRAETYGDITHALLAAVGATAAAQPASVLDLYEKYQGDPSRQSAFDEVGDAMWDLVKQHALSGKHGPIDLSQLQARAAERSGILGSQVASDCLGLASRAVNESPWNRCRYVDWKDQVELKSLFEDADLGTAYGTFFDQRFIDYLHRNFESIDRIHWRKFEGLTAEHFQREGAQVTLGPGTNDNGVDARVWWPGDDPARPAAILVQCKRQKTKVSKVVVKSLYADVLDEQAKSGLIVTTRSLSPGAEQVRAARAYPIAAADRVTLRKWIELMRSKHLAH